MLGAPLQLDVITLETGRGNVPVALERDESGRIVFGRMEQPVPTIELHPEPQAVCDALGVAGSELPVELYDNGATHPLRRARLRGARWRRCSRTRAAVVAFGVTGVQLLCGLGRPLDGADVLGRRRGCRHRLLPPGPLACHLARHGRIAWGDEITISQGAAIGRPSTLYARAEGGAGLIDRVEVGGQAVTVARGEFRL